MKFVRVLPLFVRNPSFPPLFRVKDEDGEGKGKKEKQEVLFFLGLSLPFPIFRYFAILNFDV